MTNIIEMLRDQLTQIEEVLRNGDWVQTDVMSFQRKIIFEGLMDKLDWLINSPKGSEAYVTQTKERVMNAQRRYTGDELSTMFLQGAIAEARAASLKDLALKNMMEQLEAAYAEDNGEAYTPYGRMRRSNVRSDEPAKLPPGIAADLAALGLEADLGTVSNTNGVEDTRDVS